MGIDLPIVPAEVAALLPRLAQCLAMVAAERARANGPSGHERHATVGFGRVYVSYRRLGAVLGLGNRRQIERCVTEYLVAILAVVEAA